MSQERFSLCGFGSMFAASLQSKERKGSSPSPGTAPTTPESSSLLSTAPSTPEHSVTPVLSRAQPATAAPAAIAGRSGDAPAQQGTAVRAESLGSTHAPPGLQRCIPTKIDTEMAPLTQTPGLDPTPGPAPVSSPSLAAAEPRTPNKKGTAAAKGAKHAAALIAACMTTGVSAGTHGAPHSPGLLPPPGPLTASHDAEFEFSPESIRGLQRALAPLTAAA